MSYWKILGGVAAGIGAVVVLPIAGPIGAVSLVGAAVAGTVGGIAGAAASVADEEKENDARRSGEQVATAKYKQKVDKLVEALKQSEKTLHGDKSYFQLLIALFAIGMATANADGHVSDEEMNDLNEFVAGVGHSNLPAHVKNIIAQLRDTPPSFNTAMEHVRELEHVDIKLFESVIEVISASDGRVTEEEEALLNAFRRAVA